MTITNISDQERELRAEIARLNAELMRMQGRELKFAMALNQTAALVQEPVGTVKAKRTGDGTFVHWTQLPIAGMKLYTTPPAAQPAPVQEPVESPDDWSDWKVTPPTAQRQWVGLTLSDREQLRDQFEGWNYPAILVDAISDKLKEKNT